MRRIKTGPRASNHVDNELLYYEKRKGTKHNELAI